MSYVLDWILEASRLVKEAHDNDKAHALGDIWHKRAEKLLKPTEITKVKNDPPR
jgi:hypothetical protein